MTHEAEKAYVAAERVEQLRQLAREADEDATETQAEREEHNAWLDELYAAEELARAQQEAQEARDDA